MLTKILAIIALLLVAVIVCGTLVAFATDKAHPGIHLRTIESPADSTEKATSKNHSAVASFTGIKQIRAFTKPNPQNSNGTLVIVTPWFNYPSDDTAFFEELSRKSGIMTSLIVMYFSDHTQEDLVSMGERKVKNDLRDTLNEQLVLGKISEIYFTDYIFFE